MWKTFKLNRVSSWPRKTGYYQCTIDIPGQARRVETLFWSKQEHKFKNPQRQDVFNTYEVLKTVEDENIGEYSEQLLTDEFCDFTGYVVAWKPQLKPSKKRIRKGIK